MNDIRRYQPEAIAIEVFQEYRGKFWSTGQLLREKSGLYSRLKKAGDLDAVAPHLPLRFLESWCPRDQDADVNKIIAKELLVRSGEDLSDETIQAKVDEMYCRFFAHRISKILRDNKIIEWTRETFIEYDETLYNFISRKSRFGNVLPYVDLDLLYFHSEDNPRSKGIKYAAILKAKYPKLSEREARIRYMADFANQNMTGKWTCSDLTKAESMFSTWLKGVRIAALFPYLTSDALDRFRFNGNDKEVMRDLVRELFTREQITLDEDKIDEHVAYLEMWWVAERVQVYVDSLDKDEEWTRASVIKDSDITTNELKRHGFRRILSQLDWPTLNRFVNEDDEIDSFLTDLKEKKKAEYEESKRKARQEVFAEIAQQTKSGCMGCINSDCRHSLKNEHIWDTNCVLDIVYRNPDGMTLEEVGQVLGVTRERIRQIESKALQKLRDRVKHLSTLSCPVFADEQVALLSLLDFISESGSSEFIYPDTDAYTAS